MIFFNILIFGKYIYEKFQFSPNFPLTNMFHTKFKISGRKISLPICEIFSILSFAVKIFN